MIDRFEKALAGWKEKRDSVLKHEPDRADKIASCDAYIKVIERELRELYEREASEAER